MGWGLGRSPLCSWAGSQEKGRVGRGLLGCHSGRQPLSQMWASFSECFEDPAPLLPLQASAQETSSPVPLTTWSACPVQLRRPLGSSSLCLHSTRIQACEEGHVVRLSLPPLFTGSSTPAGITVSTLSTHHLHSSRLQASEVSRITLLTGEETELREEAMARKQQSRLNVNVRPPIPCA